MPAPAAAILVNPADAVDCELFNLDLLQDAGLFVTGFDCLLFGFHVFLLWVVGFRITGDAFF